MRDTMDHLTGTASQSVPPTESFGLEARELQYCVGGKPLLDKASFCLADNGTTVIMGPNGAGKSLLLRLLHGLLDPTAGEVRWRGRGLDRTACLSQAMVFQRPVLLRRSVAANLDFALRRRGFSRAKRREGIERHLHLAGLQDKAGQSARTLSGGEQQRLAVARALACEPETLFLDEPTASLDPAATHAIEGMVHEAAEAGTKIVLISHDPGQARRLATDVMLLNRGKVEEHSPASTFFSAPASEAGRAFVSGGLLL